MSIANTEYGYGLGISTDSKYTCMMCKKKIKKGEGLLQILKVDLSLSFFYTPTTIKNTNIHFNCLIKRMKEKDPKLIEKLVAESI